MGNYGENAGPVAGVGPPTPTASSDSGSLRGGPDLLGGHVLRLHTDTGDSAFVDNPQLVNGQTASGRLGMYLDFNSANPPQPIRGDKGNTEPGPS